MGGPVGHGPDTHTHPAKLCCWIDLRGINSAGSRAIVCLSQGLWKGTEGRSTLCQREERAGAGHLLPGPLTPVSLFPNVTLWRPSLPQTEGLLVGSPHCPSGCCPGTAPCWARAPCEEENTASSPSPFMDPKVPNVSHLPAPAQSSGTAPAPCSIQFLPKGQTNPPCLKVQCSQGLTLITGD